jgi:hypothetical protein
MKSCLETFGQLDKERARYSGIAKPVEHLSPELSVLFPRSAMLLPCPASVSRLMNDLVVTEPDKAEGNFHPRNRDGNRETRAGQLRRSVKVQETFPPRPPEPGRVREAAMRFFLPYYLPCDRRT